MGLLERKPHAPAVWHGDMPVTSRYTFGLAGERFFRALKDEGQILGALCASCDMIYVPARQFCERCMDELDDWSDVGTVGNVHTFTLVYENVDGTPRDTPEAVAFVRMGDGGIVHWLGDVDPEAVHIGMPVEAVLKPPGDREGSILDIKYFRPI